VHLILIDGFFDLTIDKYLDVTFSPGPFCLFPPQTGTGTHQLSPTCPSTFLSLFLQVKSAKRSVACSIPMTSRSIFSLVSVKLSLYANRLSSVVFFNGNRTGITVVSMVC
jgi:hypothetical protein